MLNLLPAASRNNHVLQCFLQYWAFRPGPDFESPTAVGQMLAKLQHIARLAVAVQLFATPADREALLNIVRYKYVVVLYQCVAADALWCRARIATRLRRRSRTLYASDSLATGTKSTK